MDRGEARRLDVDAVAGQAPLRQRLQGEGDLGQRLDRAFRRAAAEGARAAVAIGADSPTLPASIIEAAFERLDGGADAVVAPARDGGYVLIKDAVKRPRPDDVPYPAALKAANDAAAAADDAAPAESGESEG